jgi:putative membrane protein insertion efficiency factor
MNPTDQTRDVRHRSVASALPARLACAALRFYKRFLSPVLHALTGGPGSGCRFDPSCSVYFAGAVDEHGLISGGWLGVKRLARCHPWGGCGCDPVPHSTGRAIRKHLTISQ